MVDVAQQGAGRPVATISLSLPVFIASPNDVLPEREVADQEINAIRQTAAKHRLLLSVFRWEVHATPIAGAPQATLNVELDSAELVIVIFWSRVGLGAAEELTRALRHAATGQTDNVFVYFKTAPPAEGSSPEKYAEVAQLKAELQRSNSALTWDFETPEEFRRIFRGHLGTWLQRWFDVADACNYALQHSQPLPPNSLKQDRLNAAETAFDIGSLPGLKRYLGQEAVRRYQRAGLPQALEQPIDTAELRAADPNWTRAVSAGSTESDARALVALKSGQVYLHPTPLKWDAAENILFSGWEWFFYFCAAGLARALAEADLNAVRGRPYLNPIHQYLAAMIPRDRIDAEPALVAWLSNANGVTSGLPIARNFAAYVLGMIGAVGAQDALAEALRTDAGQDVGTYCITSLGKLRARRYLPLLMDLFRREMDGNRRLILSQAISRISGAAPYEL